MSIRNIIDNNEFVFFLSTDPPTPFQDRCYR